MKTISVINLKGGVGKTTTAINMASILAREHHKSVVLIDADPQANLSAFFGAKGHDWGLYEILTGQVLPSEVVPYPTDIPTVWVVPGGMDLAMLDLAALVDGSSHEHLPRLQQLLAQYAPYTDYVIIDCPPCFSAASVASIYVSDEVLIPVKLDGFAAGGVADLEAQIQSLATLRPGLGYGCLITMWHNVEVVREGCKAFLERYGDHVFRQYIRRSDRVDESTYARQALDVFSPTSAAGRDYRAFVAEYLERGQDHE